MIPDHLCEPALLAMVPKAGELAAWSGQRHVIYLRDSAPHLAEGSGPPVQLRQCLERKLAMGDESEPLVLLEVASATDDLSNRPVLAYVRQLVRQQKVGVVWCQCTSRMSRNSVDHVILDREANRAGARFLYAWHEELDKMDGLLKELVLYVLGVVDQLEAANNKLKMYEGRKFKWAQGRLIGNSPAPYGHMYADAEGPGRVKKGRLVPNPDTCPRVVGWYRQIYDATEPDISLRQIARQLEAQGVPPPFTGKRKHPDRWSSATIRGILLNEANIGIVYGGKTRTERRDVFNEKQGRYVTKAVHTELAKEQWRPLPGAAQRLPGLTNEIFVGVGEILRDPGRAPRKLANPDLYPLRGRIYCECGSRMIPYNKQRTLKDGTRAVTLTYRCAAPVMGGECRFVIVADKLNGPVWQAVRRFIDDKEGVAKLIQNRQRADFAPLLDEINTVEELATQKRQEIKEIAAAIPKQRGFMQQQLERNGQQAQQQLETLEQRLVRLHDRRRAMNALDQRVLGLDEKLAKMRRVLQLAEQGDKEGRFDSAELLRLQRAAYKAVDLRVRVSHYPEGASQSQKRGGLPHFTLSGILGTMLSRITSSDASTVGRMSETGPRTP